MEKATPDGRVQPSVHDHSEKVKTAEIAVETTVQGWLYVKDCHGLGSPERGGSQQKWLSLVHAVPG